MFTSMWEELGVDLLEGVLVYYTTWTLLEGQKTERERGKTFINVNIWIVNFYPSIFWRFLLFLFVCLLPALFLLK